MGIWIRSQDKEMIINCYALEIDVGDGKSICSNGYVLGIYSTKEKTLKVLNEITSWINNLEYVKNIKSFRTTFVYQMPQDDEVK